MRYPERDLGTPCHEGAPILHGGCPRVVSCDAPVAIMFTDGAVEGKNFDVATIKGASSLFPEQEWQESLEVDWLLR